MAGHDFVGISLEMYFPAGSIRGDEQCVNINITDDDEFEKQENFTVTLNVEMQSFETLFIISDNDNEGKQHACMYVSSPCDDRNKI